MKEIKKTKQIKQKIKTLKKVLKETCSIIEIIVKEETCWPNPPLQQLLLCYEDFLSMLTKR